MYADRLGDTKPSIQARLNAAATAAGDSIRRRPIAGKRQRQDDKWVHDLYKDERPQILRKIGGGDLRLRLQRSSQQAAQGGGVRDLREKLSGAMHSQPVTKDPLMPKAEAEAAKPSRRSVIVATPVAVPKKVLNSTSKKTQQKADASVDGFLQNLGLEKYLITFQAEEVDMTVLEHMTDEDLKAMGIPMGPRKKILSALKLRG